MLENHERQPPWSKFLDLAFLGTSVWFSVAYGPSKSQGLVRCRKAIDEFSHQLPNGAQSLVD